MREGLRVLLETTGTRVLGFASGGELLQALEARALLCVVADMRLPDMTGLELLGELRRRAIAVPVILLADDPDVSVAVMAMRAGALDFIEKPNIGTTVLTHVERLLRQQPVPATP